MGRMFMTYRMDRTYMTSITYRNGLKDGQDLLNLMDGQDVHYLKDGRTCTLYRMHRTPITYCIHNFYDWNDLYIKYGHDMHV